MKTVVCKMCCIGWLAAFFCFSVFAASAQNIDINFTTERVLLSDIRQCDVLGDTLRAAARIVSSDSTQMAYSRYAYVELVGGNDSILIRQKYRQDGLGHFDIAIPTADLRYSGLYYIRAYTRMMLNFSEQCLAVEPVVIGSSRAGYEYPAGLLRTDAEESGLMVMRHGSRVNVQVLEDTSDEAAGGECRLYVFHDDIGLNLFPLNADGAGVMDVEELGGQSLLTFFLVDGKGALKTSRNVIVGDSPDLSVPPVWAADLDVATAYAAAGIKSREDLDRWVSESLFCRFDITQVLAGNFRFEYPLELCMTIDGHVRLEGGHLAKNGSVSAFSKTILGGGEDVLAEDGGFCIEVPDFPSGTTFFLSAKIGKKNKKALPFLKYEVNQESQTMAFIPTGARMIPVTEEAAIEQKAMLVGMKGDIVLSSAKVRGFHKAENRPDHGRFYEGNYVDVHGDVAKFHDFESILRRIPRVRIEEYELDTGELGINGVSMMERRKFILPSRGESLMTTMSASTGPSEVGIMLDGSYIDSKEALRLSTCDIEDVEYLTPHEAIRYSHRGLNGMLIIRTRQPDRDVMKRRNSKGVWVTPLGLANL